jgi:trans-aconitate methyltransferase
MGAHRAWLLSAATDMVHAAAAVCWMSTTDALMTPGNNQLKGGSAYAMIVPGLRAHLDYPHVAAIACPKPMLFINGSNDALFAVDGVEEAYAHMHNVWDECEVDDRLVTTTYDAPHTFNAAMHKQVLQFLDRWIKQ